MSTRLRAEAEHRLDHEGEVTDVVIAADIRIRQMVETARAMIRAEQEELIAIRDAEGLPDALVRPLMRQLDVRDQALASQRY